MSDMTKAPPPTGTRRMAPKLNPEEYAGWTDRVIDGDYEYARDPGTGEDTFVIVRAPAEKQHLAGTKLTADIVAGSPRLERSFIAIREKVNSTLDHMAKVADMPNSPGMAEAMGIADAPEATPEAASTPGGEPMKRSKPRPFSGARELLGRLKLDSSKTKMGDLSDG